MHPPSKDSPGPWRGHREQPNPRLRFTHPAPVSIQKTPPIVSLADVDEFIAWLNFIVEQARWAHARKAANAALLLRGCLEIRKARCL